MNSGGGGADAMPVLLCEPGLGAVASGAGIGRAAGSDDLFNHPCYLRWGLRVPAFFASLGEIKQNC